jgi:hypothetical protein
MNTQELRTQTNEIIKAFDNKIIMLSNMILKAESEKYPIWIKEDYNKSLNKTIEDKNKFIAFKKATNQYKED